MGECGHACAAGGIEKFYGRLGLEGSTLVRGLKLGVVAWTIGQLPVWLLWYAQQPWPGALVVKQLGLELIASLAIGLTIALVAGAAAKAAPRAAVSAGS